MSHGKQIISFYIFWRIFVNLEKNYFQFLSTKGRFDIYMYDFCLRFLPRIL